MKDYTIYVTEDIAKKAIEIGCPLQKVYEQYTGQPPIYYTLPHSDPNWYQCDAYYLPTAEQICGWLREEYGIVIDVDYYFNMSDTPHFEENVFEWSISYPKKENDRCSGSGFKYSYTEALLEGINTTLDLI